MLTCFSAYKLCCAPARARSRLIKPMMRVLALNRPCVDSLKSVIQKRSLAVQIDAPTRHPALSLHFQISYLSSWSSSASSASQKKLRSKAWFTPRGSKLSNSSRRSSLTGSPGGRQLPLTILPRLLRGLRAFLVCW